MSCTPLYVRSAPALSPLCVRPVPAPRPLRQAGGADVLQDVDILADRNKAFELFRKSYRKSEARRALPPPAHA